MFLIHPENKCLVTGTVPGRARKPSAVGKRELVHGIESIHSQIVNLGNWLPDSQLLLQAHSGPFPRSQQMHHPPSPSFPVAFPKAFCFLSASWICLLLNGDSFQKAFPSSAGVTRILVACCAALCLRSVWSLSIPTSSPYCVLDLSPLLCFCTPSF